MRKFLKRVWRFLREAGTTLISIVAAINVVLALLEHVQHFLT